MNSSVETIVLEKNNQLRQPKGLTILFFAELWERFGFYCIQSLLVLYLSKVFLFSDKQSYLLFSAFSALIYATPVIGGFIADRLLGFRNSILLGGCLYIIGYFTLSMPHNPYFHLALAFIIWGNGFFKSCVSSLLGTLYQEYDPRRDSGFTLFYMGINIGSFSAPLICTYIAITYGWNWGFGSAGLGMVIGIVTCLFGFKQLGTNGLAPNPEKLLKKTLAGISTQNIIYLGVIAAIILTSLFLRIPSMVNTFLVAFYLLVIISLFVVAFQYQNAQRKKFLALIVLIIFSMFFWAFYMQTFMSVTLFIDRNVDRAFLHTTIPTAMFQSVEPLLIIAFSPLFAQFWLRLSSKHKDFSTPTKFVLGLFFIGIFFFLLATGVSFATTTGLITLTWLLLAFFAQAVGELCLSPIGLSAVTQLAPPNLTGMMMGVWFLSFAGAYAIAGRIADLTSLPNSSQNPLASAHLYATNFWHFGLVAIAAGIILAAMTPYLKRMMAGE